MKNSSKIAVWSGIVGIGLLILFGFLVYFLSGFETLTTKIVGLIVAIVLMILGFLFFYSFVDLGNLHHKKMLVWSSWIAILAITASLVFGIIALVYSIPPPLPLYSTLYFSAYDLTIESVFGVVSVLFGIGLITIRKQVRLSAACGILAIISGVLFILDSILLTQGIFIPVGIFIASEDMTLLGAIGGWARTAAFIVALVLLYGESKKFRENAHQTKSEGNTQRRRLMKKARKSHKV